MGTTIERRIEAPDATSETLESALDPVLDLATLQGLRSLETLSRSPGLVNELAALFLVDTPRRIAAMREALGRADRDAARTIAHALKGSAGQIGARRLASVVARLEEQLRQRDLVDAAATLALVDAELEVVRECFARALTAP